MKKRTTKRKNASSNSLIGRSLLALTLVIILMVLTQSVTKNGFDLRQKAVISSDCGTIRVGVSTTGKIEDASDSIKIDERYPRYFLHILESEKRGRNCSTDFSVMASSCALGKTCEPNTVVDQWKGDWSVYRSDANGRVRVDISRLAPAVYTAKFKGRDSVGEWSNQISVEVQPTIARSSDAAVSTTSNLNWYFPSTPGYLFEYTSTNNRTGQVGKTRLQFEEKSSYCDTTLIPWRFTKSHRDAYWGPEKEDQLRWLVVDPDFEYRATPSYNQYYWAYGHRSYQVVNNPTTLMRDVFDSNNSINYEYGATAGSTVPAYSLFFKQPAIPYVQTFDQSVYRNAQGELPTPRCLQLDNAGFEANGQWRMRIENQDFTEIERYFTGGSYLPTNPIVRVDYFEGSNKDFLNSQLLKESWYFEQNVGPILILEKRFNGYANACTDENNQQCARSTAVDSDFAAETIENPHEIVRLDRYFHNPTLATTVSGSDGVFTTTANVDKNVGYTLRVAPTYTGYLEAKVGNRVLKWLWAENGEVRVTPSMISGFPSGAVVTAQFRIWVPDDAFTGEQRVSDTNVNWSNPITVNIL